MKFRQLVLWLVPVLLFVGGCQARHDDLNLVIARNAMAQDRADWARTYFAEDRRLNPDRDESILGEAVAWSAGYQRSRSKTRELLRQYLEKRPGDQEALGRYIRELLVLRDFDQAEHWSEFLDHSPEADLLRAQIVATNRPEEALELVESVTARAPDNAAAWAMMAEIEERLQHFESSVAAAEQAVALNPFQYSTIYVLARVTRRLGQIEASDRALKLHEIVSALEADGTRKSVGVGEELHLLEEMRQFVDRQGGVYQARLVAALFKAGRITAAIEKAEHALGERSHTVGELAALAVLADDAGARALAKRLFVEIVEKQPDHVGAQSSLIIIDLEAGRLDEAQRRLSAAMNDHPDFARLWFLKGRIALAEGESDVAVEAFERALLLAPWEWSWRIALAELLIARRDNDALSRLVSRAPEHPPGWQQWVDQHQRLIEAGR